ncbi:MAG: cobalamin B12-binding domain-containing protein, partial [Planctomycetes bacterium]|nr:cobalamin B12-binding domain-containing protein [Planctomycetota bacterium]
MIKNIKNKVILISSSNFKIYAELPMGLMTVATILQQQYGLLPTILDLPQESSEDSCITEFVNNLGVDEDTLFVGFSTVCDTIPRSFSVARILKQRYPDIPIVFGGPHTTLTAADAIKHYDFIDVIVCGEAEPVLGSLIESIRNNTNKSIPGLIFRSDPDFNKLNLQGLMAPLIPIDSLPQIDYDLYPDSWGEEELPIEAGRGCPFGCTFCSTKDFFKRRFRIKTPETIVGEIRSIIEKRG